MIFRKYIPHLIYILILCPWLSYAQESTIIPPDITAESNDSIKANRLLQFAKEELNNKTQKLLVLHTALELAQKNKDQKTQFLISTSIASVYYQKGKFDSCKYFFSKNIALVEEKNIALDPELLATNYNDLGAVYLKLKDYNHAIEVHLKALKIREQVNSPKLSSSYNNLGLVYMNFEKYEKAIDYFKKSLHLKQKSNNKAGIINCLNNLGIVYKKIRHHKNAKEYYNQALALSREIQDVNKTCNALRNLAVLAFWKDNYNLAISYYEEVLELQKKQDNQTMVIESILNIAQMNLEADRPSEAFEYLNLAMNKIKKEDIYASYLDVYILYSNYYTLIGNSEQSSAYYLKYKKVQDSLALKKNAMTLADIETKYETEKKEQEIELLKQKNIISTLELERIQTQRKWIFSIVFLLLIIISVLIWLYQYRSRTNKELEVLNSTKDKLFTIIGHDLKNPLIGFRSITQSLSSNLETMDKSSILYFIQKLEKSSNQLYLLIQNLLQWAINESGQLSNNPQRFALEQLVTDVFNLFKINAEREEIQLINEVPMHSFVHADLKITQTILRNLIDNAIKFTPKGGTVCVQTTVRNNILEVLVRDTGVGMSEEEQQNLFQQQSPNINNDIPQKGTGIGLLLCKELAERLSSSIKVNSTINQGTVFSFSLQQAKNA